MDKPPFEINDTIINLALEINNKLGKLEVNLDKKKELLLRKISKIKSVHSSCAIEANSLTDKEVEAVVNGKRILAPPDEIIEVKNAYHAYTKMSEYKPYSIKSFLQAHRYLTENLVEEAGKFRSGNVAVYNGDQVLHMGARPEFVYHLVDELFQWGAASEVNPLIKSGVIHYELEIIHPFADGNGRIGRLWQSVILYNYNPLFELIPIETLIYEHQQRYYEAIENSSKVNSSTAFIEFLLKMIDETIDTFRIDNNVVNLNQIKAESLSALTKREKEMLNIIIHDFDSAGYFTSADLNGRIDKGASSIRLYLKKLVETEVLIATGNNKGRKYQVNAAIFEDPNETIPQNTEL